MAALGLITLGALVPARRGSRPALITVLVSRVISAILAVGAFVAKPVGRMSAYAGYGPRATAAARAVRVVGQWGCRWPCRSWSRLGRPHGRPWTWPGSYWPQRP